MSVSCSVCTKTTVNEGFKDRPLCRPCYWVDYKNRSLAMTDKTCVSCGTQSSFKWYSGSVCGKCYGKTRNKINYAANPDKYRAAALAFRKNNPLKSRERNLKKYGLTVADYNALFEAQRGRCAICKSKNPGRRGISYFPVDHCHTTGQVRGLLCSWCNKAIGLLKDDTDILANAIAYLRASR